MLTTRWLRTFVKKVTTTRLLTLSPITTGASSPQHALKLSINWAEIPWVSSKGENYDEMYQPLIFDPYWFHTHNFNAEYFWLCGALEIFFKLRLILVIIKTIKCDIYDTKKRCIFNRYILYRFMIEIFYKQIMIFSFFPYNFYFLVKIYSPVYKYYLQFNKISKC